MVAGSLGAIIITYATVEQILWGPVVPFQAVFVTNNILFGLFAAVVVVLAARRTIRQERLEQVTLGVFAIESILFNGILPALTYPTLPLLFSDTTGDDIWFLLLICILILHLFPLRRAFWLTGGMYLVSTAIMLWRLWLGLPGGEYEQALAVVRIYLFGAVLLSFLYLLVRYRDNLLQMRLQHDLLEQLAFVDQLTDLHNRHSLNRVLAQQIQLAAPLSVLICDIDHFKQVNDRLGHSAGDAVLRRMAQVLRENVRAADVVGRWGGEEFLVVMSAITPDVALTSAERLCDAVARAPILDDMPVTLSIGVADYAASETLDSLLQRADSALYAAKHAGRNRARAA